MAVINVPWIPRKSDRGSRVHCVVWMGGDNDIQRGTMARAMVEIASNCEYRRRTFRSGLRFAARWLLSVLLSTCLPVCLCVITCACVRCCVSFLSLIEQNCYLVGECEQLNGAWALCSRDSCSNGTVLHDIYLRPPKSHLSLLYITCSGVTSLGQACDYPSHSEARIKEIIIKLNGLVRYMPLWPAAEIWLCEAQIAAL